MHDRSTAPPDLALGGLVLELRQGLRQLARARAFAVTVVLLLALGIGINTATYSVVRNVLLEPLPFRSPEQLTVVWWVDKGTPASFLGSSPVSGPNFLDWRRESRSFAQLVALRPVPLTLAGSGQAERLAGTLTTAGLFEMLQVQPLLGRSFRPDEEQPGRNRVAVISHAFWRARLAGDPRVLGRALTLDGEARTVVGVMPPGFQHPSPWSIGTPTEVWIPSSLAALQTGRDQNNWVVLGRLKPDVPRGAAQAEMSALALRLEREYPDVNNPGEPLLVPLRHVLVGRLSSRLWMLLGASALVPAVVCLNVARETESAIGHENEASIDLDTAGVQQEHLHGGRAPLCRGRADFEARSRTGEGAFRPPARPMSQEPLSRGRILSFRVARPEMR